ncbi:MAG: OpgC domain-containing protein [Acetobacteraceae bacterium]|nr:OpgC domain-containing protein [Acetobacteraceae bacterium]
MSLVRGGSRDLRVDFFRGLALWWIYTDHIPGDVLGAWSLRNFALCDATEVFVLLAGYGAGLAYGRTALRTGFLPAAAAVVQRAWTLYIAHIFLFVVFSAQVGFYAAALARTSYLDESKLDVLADRPYQALLEALTLRYQPSLLNILPLYVVLLLLFVPALPLLRFPRLLAALSVSLYLAVQVSGFNLPSWTGGGWFFDPFAWQLLFVGGAILATNPITVPARPRLLDVAAALVIAFGLAVIYLVWGRAETGFLLPLPVVHWLLYMDKTTLDPLRVASIAALLWAVVRLVPAEAGWLRWRVAQPLVLMGQHSLPVFCWGIFIGFFGRMALEWRYGASMQVLVNAGGAAAMVAVALVAAWYGAHGRGARPAAPAATAPPAVAPVVPRAEARAKALSLALALAIGLVGSSPALAAAPDLCPAEAAFTLPSERLSSFARALHGHDPVDILAVGSASTAESGAAYPREMLETLQAAYPSATLRLDVRGGRGLTATELLDLLTQALARRRYALVLWQTGTVDAVRGLRPEELADALEKGASAVIAAGADLVLIDPQFSRFLSANVDLAPYQLVMEHAASLPGVVLFRRYALMREWVIGGGLDIEAADPAKRPVLGAVVQACVGRALAGFVMAGAGTQLVGQ